MDKSHLHTHFAINSVSFLDGKKYNSCKAANQRLRDVSDSLCNERSLSVIENPSKERTNRTVYLAEKKGEPTRYNIFRQAIDKAIAASMTSRDFERNLKIQGFEIKMTGKYWSIKMIDDNRTTRLYRLGEQYTSGNITKRIYERGLYRPVPFHIPQKPKPRRVKIHGNLRTAKKLTGFRALYVHYLYLLGKLPKKKPRPPRHPIMWEDIRKLDTYTAQIKLLHINKIDTSPQLQAHKDSTQNHMNSLIGERMKIYNKLRRAKEPDVIASLKKQRDALTAEIAIYRKEIKLCDGIFENTQRMKEKMAVIREHEKSLQQQKTKMKERGSRDAR